MKVTYYFAWGVALYLGRIQGHQIENHPGGLPRTAMRDALGASLQCHGGDLLRCSAKPLRATE